MKEFYPLTMAFALFALVACKDEAVEAESVIVSVSASTVLVGAQPPTVSATVAPSDTPDKTVKWLSSNPEVISVNYDTGILTMNQTEDVADPIEVIITAISVNGKTGSKPVKVVGEITKYGIIDCKAELGLLILDRNIGATKAYDKNASQADKDASIGNYYQWGRNTPVASGTATTSSLFDAAWTVPCTGSMDWSDPKQTPCPKGWGMPNKAQIELIGNKAWADYDWDTQTDEEFAAAKALYTKLKIARNGLFRVGTTKYLPTAGAFWSGYMEGVDASGNKKAYSILDNLDIMRDKNSLVSNAMPIRCVKVAP